MALFSVGFMYVFPVHTSPKPHSPSFRPAQHQTNNSISVCIAGGLRVYYSVVVNNSLDGTWIGVSLWSWEVVEVNLGIACACVPALKPLCLRWFPKFISSIFGTSAANTTVGTWGNTGTFDRGGGGGGGTGRIHVKGAGTFIPMDSPTDPARGLGLGLGGGVVKTTIYGYTTEEARAGKGRAAGVTASRGAGGGANLKAGWSTDEDEDEESAIGGGGSHHASIHAFPPMGRKEGATSSEESLTSFR